MEAKFFKSGQAFRAWLARHCDKETELLVGFYKTQSGLKGITYAEALDEALAAGWIDGVRRRIDDTSYSIRFSPRRARSIWSAVNIKRVKELIAEGRMQPAGMAAFEKRDEKRSAIYSYERSGAAFEGETLAEFMADEKAWAYYQSQPTWYRRTSAFWVVSAKKPETRARRLATLSANSRRGERIDMLTPSGKSKTTRS